MNDADDDHLLMFSGGRDSTIAALRLAKSGSPITLVTVSAPHLHGIVQVKARLAEIAGSMPPGSSWIQIEQPRTTGVFTSTFARTCLPCQHDYALAGAFLARQLGIRSLAFGYVRYQSDWPEQSEVAVSQLRAILSDNGISLALPAYDLSSKGQAIRELEALGLSADAMEQKCIRQITNIKLSDEQLIAHTSHWADQLTSSLRANQNLKVSVLDQRQLEYFSAVSA